MCNDFTMLGQVTGYDIIMFQEMGWIVLTSMFSTRSFFGIHLKTLIFFGHLRGNLQDLYFFVARFDSMSPSISSYANWRSLRPSPL